MPRRDREPPAPTPMDERESADSLDSSPWVKARIRELGLVGKKVSTWLPPRFVVRTIRRKTYASRS